jgi:hypothetical protein
MTDVNLALSHPVMNWENGEAFACFIESLEDDTHLDIAFDMNKEHIHADSTNHPCGTAMCIGGWCTLALPVDQRENITISGAAMQVLRISQQTAQSLCWPSFDSYADDFTAYSLITPALAGRAIRNAIHFGDPNWDVVMKDAIEQAEADDLI